MCTPSTPGTPAAMAACGCLYRCFDLGQIVADQRWQKAGRPKLTVSCANGGDGFHAGIVVKEPVAAAVHLRVDEAGQQALPAEVDDFRARGDIASDRRSRRSVRRRLSPHRPVTSPTGRAPCRWPAPAPSVRLRYLGEMRRSVRVESASHCQRIGGAIEALDLNDRSEQRGAGDCRQANRARGIFAREENACTALSQPRRRRLHRRSGFIRLA